MCWARVQTTPNNGKSMNSRVDVFKGARHIFVHASDNVSIKAGERCCGFTQPGEAVAEVISEPRSLAERSKTALINQRPASRERLRTLLKSWRRSTASGSTVPWAIPPFSRLINNRESPSRASRSSMAPGTFRSFTPSVPNETCLRFVASLRRSDNY